MSAHAKVNKAFPPIAEVRVSEEGLRTLLEQDQAALQDFEERYASRLELRALTCTQDLSIGRLDSISTIKTLPISRDCLNDQDAQLLTLLGIRQVAMRMAQPPLRPLAPLGQPTPISISDGTEIVSVDAASEAGVIVVRGTRSELYSLEIPGGKKVANLPQFSDLSYRQLLSPNGRVAAIQIGNRAVAFVDTESGAKLWEPKGINQLLAWMPELSVAIARGPKSGELLLIDFQSGRIDPHPVGWRENSWALSVGTSPSRLLVGSQRQFALIEHVRTKSGISGSIIKEFRIKEGQGVTSKPPTLMLDGKAIVFVTGRGLMTFDMETGVETVLPTTVIMARGYAKLSETKLLFDSYATPSSGSWIFDIKQSTLSPVKVEAGRPRGVDELAGRTGFILKGYREIWIGDEVNAGDPSPLDTVLGSLILEHQQMQIERATQTPSDSSAYGMRSSTTILESTGVIENIVFANLAKDAHVEAVGVYEGRGASHGAGKDRTPGVVDVIVRKSSKPIVLVVSSYEPVIWKLTLLPGAQLSGVLVSGYYPSKVIGAGSVRIADMGKSYCYKSGGCANLGAEVQRWTGKRIAVFQGRYQGNTFTVGGA